MIHCPLVPFFRPILLLAPWLTAVGGLAQTCQFNVQTRTFNVNAPGQNLGIPVTASPSNCATPASTQAQWIVLTGPAEGTGSRTVSFRVDPNPTIAPRTGTVTLAGITVTINQAADCAFAVNPAAVSVPASPRFLGDFAVASTNGRCIRNAVATQPWITISLGQTGTGSGIVGYAIEANNTPNARTGSINVGNASFTVNQAAQNCNFNLNLTGNTFIEAGGGTRTAALTSNCQWQAQASAEWIRTSPASGNAGGTLTITITPNTTPSQRSGTLTIGNQTLRFTQAAANCSYAMAPDAMTVPAGGAMARMIALTTTCDWTASASAPWITLTSAASGTGSASLQFSASANTFVERRSATITAGAASAAITQEAPACTFSLGAARAEAVAAGGPGSVTVTSSCDWQASSAVPWITINSGPTGSRNGQVAYTVAQNASPAPRIGILTIGGQSFTVTQAAAPCTYTVMPTAFDFPSGGGQGSVTVTTDQACQAMPETTTSWIRFGSQIAGTGQLQQVFLVDANSSADARTGSFTIGGSTVQVRQSGTTVIFTAAGVVHGATFLTGAIAPGELLAIFGTGIGPMTPAGLQTTPDGLFVTTVVADTRVLFDDIPAPITFASNSQTNVVAPYGIAGRATVRAVIEHRGQRSAPVTLNVADAAPGLFSADSSGKGPGAILNQDSSLNSASNRARRGSVVILYGTGEGVTNPAAADGAIITGEPLPKPVLEVRVTIGGQPATVEYAGAAPTLVAGVLQINAVVPESITPGDAVPVVVTVGGKTSQPGLTVAVE